MLLLFSVMACSEKQEIRGSDDYTGPLLVSKNLDVTYTDSARIKFTMIAKEQIKYKDQNEVFPQGIYLEFYDRQEKRETSLASRYAEYNKEKDLWYVKDSVVLKNFNRKRTLKSEELYWDPNKQEVWCDTTSQIQIIDEGQLLKGKGLKAKDDFSDYEIYKPSGIFEL